MGKYSEYDRASLSAGWRILAWVVAAMVIVFGLGWAILTIRAATSETKGQLDKQIQINKGANQIQSQELFEDLYRKVKEYDANLDQALADKLANPGDDFYATNYTGLLATCKAAVEQYDAQARKVSSAQWISADLPLQIDRTDPLTDCEAKK